MQDPISFRFDKDHGVLIAVLLNEVKDADLVRAFGQVFDSAEFDPSYDTIVDLRRMETSPLTVNGLGVVASMAQTVRKRSELPHRPKTAIIAGGDLAYGLGRQYRSLASAVPAEIEVFRDESEALAWIGEPGLNLAVE